MITIPGYKIDRAIGSGGMAEVFLGHQASVDRPVAIKVMNPSLAVCDESFAKRFIKEANVGSLNHRNIITVYDAGKIDGYHYIVMEYISGGDLATIIKQGNLSFEQKINIIKQIAVALGYSYSKGFVHRDVKPENILFREDGTPVLADFGIAKAVTASTSLTTDGTYIGSPYYMSPEQIRGHEVDHRSDLYSLGIVFYELLSGYRPYDKGDTYAVGIQHISEPIPPLPQQVAQFQSVIDKMLAKEAYQRYQDHHEFIQGIDSVLETANPTVIQPVKVGGIQAKSSQKAEKKTLAIPLIYVFAAVVITSVITAVAFVLYESYMLDEKKQRPLVTAEQHKIPSAQNGQKLEQKKILLQIEKLLFRAEQLAMHISINQEKREELAKIYSEILALDDSNQAAVMGTEMLAALYLQEAYEKFEYKQIEIAKIKLAKSVALVETIEAVELQKKIDIYEIKQQWR